jgi:hypothetical protein
MRYRRAKVPGGTYFFTVNLAERKRTLLVDHIDDLRNAVQKVLTDHPFRIDGWVFMTKTGLLRLWIDGGADGLLKPLLAELQVL